MNIATHAKVISLALDRLTQWACVLMLVLLVLDVWLGIMARYVFPFPMTFTEELARYLMIWMALLAVSCGIVHRENIGVEFFLGRFSESTRRKFMIIFDIIAFVFFATLFWYGLDFVERGFKRITMIYDMPKGYPYLIVPIASALACIQLVLTGLHDAFSDNAPPSGGASTLLNSTDQTDIGVAGVRSISCAVPSLSIPTSIGRDECLRMYRHAIHRMSRGALVSWTRVNRFPFGHKVDELSA